tara:strand:+ start:119 stop:394 length:276 start_codon:yes stop_codon:yes gene_type:complete
MKKLSNGQLIDFNEQEIQELNTWNEGRFQREMENLRFKRNQLLAVTDWTANSDVTMSSEMTTYRQALRDITNGLTTVEDVEAVVFPEKPEV